MPDDAKDEIALRNRLSTMVRSEPDAFTIDQVVALLAYGGARCESPGLETRAHREAERELDGKDPPIPSSTLDGE